MMAPVQTANKEHFGPKLLGEDFNQAVMFAVGTLEEDNALKSLIHAPPPFWLHPLVVIWAIAKVTEIGLTVAPIFLNLDPQI